MTGRRIAHFIHIAKTGGHTLEAVYDEQFGPEALFYSRWGREYGEGPRGRPMGVFLKSREASIPGRVYFPELLGDVAERFLALPAESRKGIRLIYGKNLEFGLDGFLPQPLDYFTLLRDPVDRVLSQYFFTVDYAQKPGHISLYDHIAAHIQPNMQTLMMSGPHGLNPQPEGGEMLERAKKNLGACKVVGLTEHFGETVLLLAKAFDWKEVRYVRRKVNKTRPRIAEVPREVLLRLAADNELDVALYAFGKALFEETLRAYGPGLKEDMETLGRRNVHYRSWAQSKQGGR